MAVNLFTQIFSQAKKADTSVESKNEQYLLVVRVKYGLSLTDGTDSSIRGYDLIKVSVSSGKVVDDL